MPGSAVQRRSGFLEGASPSARHGRPWLETRTSAANDASMIPLGTRIHPKPGVSPAEAPRGVPRCRDVSPRKVAGKVSVSDRPARTTDRYARARAVHRRAPPREGARGADASSVRLRCGHEGIPRGGRDSNRRAQGRRRGSHRRIGRRRRGATSRPGVP